MASLKTSYGKMGFGGSEPTGTLPITANGNYDVKDYASADVNVPSSTLIEKSITANGTYNAFDDEADGFSKVVVDTPSANIPYIEETYVENSSKKLQLRDWKYVGHTRLIQAQGNGSSGFGGFLLFGSLTIPSTVDTAASKAFKGLCVPYIEYGGQVMSNNMFDTNQVLSKVWIRETCMTIPASSYAAAPFYNTVSQLYIYVEADSKPAGFGTYWDWTDGGSQASVVYGQKTKPW